MEIFFIGKKKAMNTKPTRSIFVILLALIGLGAIFGGGILIICPSGELFKLPLSMLENFPFKDFLIPGIILLSVLELAHIGLTLVFIKKPKYKVAELFNFYKDIYWVWNQNINKINET